MARRPRSGGRGRAVRQDSRRRPTPAPRATAAPRRRGRNGVRTATGPADAPRLEAADQRRVLVDAHDCRGRRRSPRRSAWSYSSDGIDLLETFGPEHDVRLSNGTLTRARSHVRHTYDEGAPAGGPYHLVTTVAMSAYVVGQAADFDTRIVKIEYDFPRRLEPRRIVDPAGLNLRTLTAYDAAGLAVSITTPGGMGATNTTHTTKTVYWTAGTNGVDAACGNRPEWVHLPCAVGPAAQPTGSLPSVPTSYYTYDLDNNVRTVTEMVGSTTLRTSASTYDAAGRVDVVTTTSAIGTSVPTTKVVYDSANGRATRTQALSGTTVTAEIVRTYDALGRLTTYDDATGAAPATTGFDELDRPVTSFDGKRTTTYAHEEHIDPRGLLTRLVDGAAGTFTATYDADGNVATMTYPNGLVATWTYDEAGSAVQLSYAKDGETWLVDHVIEDIYGKWVEHGGVSAQAYTYDAAGRLAHVIDEAADSATGCTTRQYQLNADSNRTETRTWPSAADGTCQNTTSTAVTHSYDAASRILDTGYGYDALGRTTALPADAVPYGGAVTIDYHVNDFVRTLTQGGIATTFALDVTLDRVASWTRSGTARTNHFDDDSDSPVWTEEGGSSWTRNVAGISGDLAATENYDGSSSTIVFLIHNLHGDIVAEAATTGAGLTATFDTDEFGNRRTTSSRRYQWLGAHTRVTDTSSGLVIMGVRLYTPVTGRFLSVDPVPGGDDNPYSYASHDPVNNVDLDGRIALARDFGGWGGGSVAGRLQWRPIRIDLNWWKKPKVLRPQPAVRRGPSVLQAKGGKQNKGISQHEIDRLQGILDKGKGRSGSAQRREWNEANKKLNQTQKKVSGEKRNSTTKDKKKPKQKKKKGGTIPEGA